jgi:hypothetical protein
LFLEEKMASHSDPWYFHAAMYVIIVVLIALLVKVAIIDPKTIVAEDRFYRKESRLRMDNLKEAQILYYNKYNRFSANIDTLVSFVKYDPYVDSVVQAYDSLSRRPANPFKNLSHGEFTPDSLYHTPRSNQRYIVNIDTTTTIDTIVTRAGKVLRLDTNTVIGSRYVIEDPDGYGTIGSVESDALKNTASWE